MAVLLNAEGYFANYDPATVPPVILTSRGAAGAEREAAPAAAAPPIKVVRLGANGPDAILPGGVAALVWPAAAAADGGAGAARRARDVGGRFKTVAVLHARAAAGDDRLAAALLAVPNAFAVSCADAGGPGGGGTAEAQSRLAGFVRDLYQAKGKVAAAATYFDRADAAQRGVAFARCVEQLSVAAVPRGDEADRWQCAARLRRSCASLHELARADWEELVAVGVGRREAMAVSAFMTSGGQSSQQE